MSRNSELERSFEGCFDAWCALWTDPGAELDVALAIEKLGHSTFVLRRRPLRFRKLGAPRAILPRYVLAKVAMLGAEDWGQVCSIDGVRGFLWAGNRIARIPESQIDRMRVLQDQRAHIELAWWLVQKGKVDVRLTPKYSKAPKTRAARRKWRKLQEQERENLARKFAA